MLNFWRRKGGFFTEIAVSTFCLRDTIFGAINVVTRRKSVGHYDLSVTSGNCGHFSVKVLRKSVGVIREDAISRPVFSEHFNGTLLAF